MSPGDLVRVVETVTWVKVPKPTLDLVGIVLSSLGLAGLCALLALTLGCALGLAFVLRTRRSSAPAPSGLRLLDARRAP